MQAFAGRILILIGIICVLSGIILLLNIKIPWLFKLPGDIRIEKESFRFYFPITTCILISAVLALLFLIIRYLSR